MAWPIGDGEMAVRMRAHDWTTSPLGPIEDWPQYLRTTVELLLAHGFPMGLLWGPEHIQIYNDPHRALMGDKHPAGLGRPLHENWPEVREVNEPLLRRAGAGETIDLKGAHYRLARHGTLEDAWYDLTLSPVRDAGGIVAGVLVTVFDTTGRFAAERHRDRIEAELRQRERQQAFLLSLSDALRPLADPAEIQATAMRVLGQQLGVARAQYYEADRTGAYLESAGGYTDGAAPVTGRMRMDDFGPYVRENFLAGRTLAVDDVASDSRISEAALQAYHALGLRAFVGIPLVKDGRLVGALGLHHASARGWSTMELAIAEETAERTWAALQRARAEVAHRDSEERLRILVAELQHRVRNILTVVRSVFSRTAEIGGDPDEIADHFKGRLDALARTQAIVTQSAARTADLENLIRDELLSVGVNDSETVRIEGPDVTLGFRAAESLGLAIHELTTNALKYGALKSDGATLDIKWSVDLDYGGNRVLNITWVEQGVPAVSVQPKRQGFGKELIEEALPYRLKATTKLELRGGGVRCTISVPLTAGDENAS